MKRTGFTLIEMMITTAISAVLLGIAVPNMRNFIVSNRISTQANDLLADLALARSEAVKRGIRISMCASSDGSTCTGSSWNRGRIIFTDSGTAGTVDIATDTVLRVSEALSGGSSLTSTPSAIASYIQYSSSGRVVSAGSFTLCKTGYKGRLIRISNTGRASKEETSASCA